MPYLIGPYGGGNVAEDYDSPDNYGSYAVPQGMNQGKAELLDKIKPDVAVDAIRQRLLGKELIDGQWKIVPALQKRKLSEIGAWEISNLMLGVSTVNVTIGKMKDSEIKERLKRIAKTAMRMMITNWIEYEVKNVSQFDYVYQIVFTNTFAVLSQANDASIQDLLKATVFENRNVSSQPKEKTTQKISRILGMSD